MLYPIISGHLSDDAKPGRKSRRQVFQEMAIQVEHYYKEGSIPNTVFVDAKYILNGALDHAYEAIRHAHVSGRHESLSIPMRKFVDQFGIIYLHMIPGLLNRSKQIKMDGEVHPYYTEMMALLEEALPLSEKMTALKDSKPTKRQPKPVEEQVVGYHPPKVSTEAEKEVVALLEGVTVRSYEELQAQQLAHYRYGLKLFLEMLENNKKLTPYEFYVSSNKFAPNHTLAEVVEKARVEWSNPYVSKPAAAVTKIFKAHAQKVADEYRTFFVHKNFRKIASIIDGKKMPFNGCELQSSVSLTGLEGMFFFDFEDGSSFKVVNQVVFSYSKYGKPFQRFPLTFREIVLPSRQQRKRLSEEQMNTVFLKGGE